MRANVLYAFLLALFASPVTHSAIAAPDAESKTNDVSKTELLAQLRRAEQEIEKLQRLQRIAEQVAEKLKQSERDQKLVIEKLQKKIEVLEFELTRSKVSFLKSIEELRAENDRLRAELSKMMRENETLRELKKALEKGLAETVKVNGGTPRDRAVAVIEAVVNRVSKSGDYVEISVGHDDGIRKGMKLDVYNGERHVGQIEVVETKPDVSIANSSGVDGTIKRGFRVSTKRIEPPKKALDSSVE